MTALLILLVLATAAYVVAMTRTLQHDRPREAPVSHLGWGSAQLPSHPFSQDV